MLRRSAQLIPASTLIRNRKMKNPRNDPRKPPPGEVKALNIYPFDLADHLPDVIVFEDRSKELIWISLAYLNIIGGKRVSISTSVLQTTSADATVILYKDQLLNQIIGCDVYRDDTKNDVNEAMLRFYDSFQPIMSSFGVSQSKNHSRFSSRKAYSVLEEIPHGSK